MSHIKDKKSEPDHKIKSLIFSHLKKREQDFNKSAHISLTEMKKIYHDNVTVYTHFLKSDPIIINDKLKACEIEKGIYTNQNKHHMKISHPIVHMINEYLMSVEYTLNITDNLNSELTQMIQKLTIKDVNMDNLMLDLNQNGINVNNLLNEFNKNGKSLDHLLGYLESQKISLTTIMSILYKNNVTINGLVANEFIHNLIKQSPTYSWFLSGKELPIKSTKQDVKTQNKKINKIHVYTIYKIKHEEYSIISINWCNI